jgi:hypothetical protein
MALRISDNGNVQGPAKPPETTTNSVKSEGAPSETLSVGGLSVNIIPWDKYVPQAAKLKGSLPLYTAAFLQGTIIEEYACYKDWNWRCSRWYALENGNMIMGNVDDHPEITKALKNSIQNELFRGAKEKFGSLVTRNNYLKYLKQLDAKSLIQLTALAIEATLRYQTKSGMTLDEMYDGESFQGTCHVYTYLLKNVLSWLRTVEEFASLESVYIVEAYAPKHMWPTIIEFRANGDVVGMNIDPTIDDFHGGKGDQLQTASSWTSKAIPLNFYYNTMLGLAFFIKKYGNKEADAALKEMCGTVVDKYGKDKIMNVYSYFSFYMHIDQESIRRVKNSDISRKDLQAVIYNGIMASINTSPAGDK